MVSTADSAVLFSDFEFVRDLHGSFEPLRIKRMFGVTGVYPPAFYGFKIVQLTDLRLGLLVSESFVEGAVRRTNK